MAIWKLPPIIKIYEALGSIADQRLKIEGNTAKVYSSSLGKFYTVIYEPRTKSIMCNDNGSYWQNYLGYPAIAYLMHRGVIPYSTDQSAILKDIKWKEINTKYKNDWDKTRDYCHDLVIKRGGNLAALLREINQIYQYLEENPFNVLGQKITPPKGY